MKRKAKGISKFYQEKRGSTVSGLKSKLCKDILYNKMSVLLQICRKIVTIFFGLIILFLTVSSIAATSYIANLNEHTDYVFDKWWLHILIVLVCLCAALYLKQKGQEGCKFLSVNCFENSFKAVFVLYIGILFAWLLMIQVYPCGDGGYCLTSVAEWLHGNSEKVVYYLSLYNNQKGLICWMYLWGLITGTDNFLFMQLLNIIAIGGSVICIVKLTNIMFDNKKAALFAGIVSMLFLPFGLYLTYVYGTLPGLFFSLIGVLYEYKYLNKRSRIYGFISVFSITAAVILKSNYLIVLIAMIIFVFLDILQTHWKSSILIFAFLVGTFLGRLLIDTVIDANFCIADGAPPTAWIAMGFQEGDRAPGWYNAYNTRTFIENDFDTDKTNEIAKREIRDSIDRFVNNPKYAVSFFGQKALSQWNDPTFQSLWLIGEGSEYKIEHSRIVTSILNGKLKWCIEKYMNYFHFIILFGVCLWLMLDKKEIKKLFIPIVFIGGFLFHMMWEANSRYTFTYFFMLIPYSVMGWNLFVNRIYHAIAIRRQEYLIKEE